MATVGSPWSAVCVLPGAFKEAEDAVTVNGVPLYALSIPFNCQPPARAASTPLDASGLPLPKGNSALLYSWKLCVRS
jgi:hypothetical protein